MKVLSEQKQKQQQQLQAKVLAVGKDIHRRQPNIQYKDYIRKSVSENDFSTLIDYSVVINDEAGKPLIVYLKVPELPSVQMVNALKGVEFSVKKRTQGLIARSKIFGYMPREQIRKDYCSSTAMARESPNAHKIVCEFGGLLSQFYEQYCPDTFQMHMDISKHKILDDWRIEHTPFTSGIINKNSAIKYHFDAGNIRKVYSNMVCFKKDCEGGHLAIPEFDIGLDISNKSILLFDGQAILHGVTPFKLTSNEAYRYTIVYYTLQQMWSCEPVSVEVARIRQRKFERELRRYKRLTGELKPEDDPFYNSRKRKTTVQ